MTDQVETSDESRHPIGAAFETAYEAEATARGWNVGRRGVDRTARTWCNEPHWDVADVALDAMFEQVNEGAVVYRSALGHRFDFTRNVCVCHGNSIAAGARAQLARDGHLVASPAEPLYRLVAFGGDDADD